MPRPDDAPRAPFAEAFWEEFRRKGRTLRGLARNAELDESSLRTWRRTGRWPRAVAVHLALHLGMAADEREFDARYSLQETQPNSRTLKLVRASAGHRAQD